MKNLCGQYQWSKLISDLYGFYSLKCRLRTLTQRRKNLQLSVSFVHENKNRGDSLRPISFRETRAEEGETLHGPSRGRHVPSKRAREIFWRVSCV